MFCLKYWWLSPVMTWRGQHSFHPITKHNIMLDFHMSRLIVDMLDMFDCNLHRSEPKWQEHADFISKDESRFISDLPSSPSEGKNSAAIGKNGEVWLEENFQNHTKLTIFASAAFRQSATKMLPFSKDWIWHQYCQFRLVCENPECY